MTRLIVLLTWPPATWVLLYNADQLPNYLGFYVGGYAAGKAADIFTGGKNANTSKVVETDSDSAGDDSAANDSVSKGKSGLRGQSHSREGGGI
jgi:hypothetical protein